mmetsp:Transcript_91552/g.245256  ORF Transcript_91552/g.245256 Transcript_91552/m.245256 type:complete len:227 (-) Transcript_91552:499-1179(-)
MSPTCTSPSAGHCFLWSNRSKKGTSRLQASQCTRRDGQDWAWASMSEARDWWPQPYLQGRATAPVARHGLHSDVDSSPLTTPRPRQVLHGGPTYQWRELPSALPDRRPHPSGEKLRQVIRPWWPRRLRTYFHPSQGDQTRSAPFSAPATTMEPSGENATARTGPSWPSSWRAWVPPDKSKTSTLLTKAPAARLMESGEKAQQRMLQPWVAKLYTNSRVRNAQTRRV